MPGREQIPGAVRFATFELDPATGELRKSGIRIRIPGQPLAILKALLECPGEVVSRETLRRTLWPDGIHVDYEHNLNKAMNRLRDVLSDTADSPRFIETLPGRGYRFLVEVTLAGQPSAWPVVPAPVPPPTPPPGHAMDSRTTPAETSRPWVRWSIVAVVLVVLAGAAARLGFSGRAANSPSFTATTLTTVEGRETSPSLSPDGTRLVFVGDGEHFDNIDVYLLKIGDARPTRLTHHAAADYSPAWSPDGKWIAFLRDLDLDRAGVFLISPDGSIERHLRTIQAPPTGYASFGIPRRALAWSLDSRFLIASDTPKSGAGYSLVRIDANDGSSTRILTSTDPVRGDVAPAISPDGRQLAFVRGGVAHAGSSICVVAVDFGLEAARRPECMQLRYPWIDSLAWSGRPGELIFSAAWTLDGSRVLARVPLGLPERAEVLTGAGADGVEPTLSAKANRLVYSRTETKRSGIWKLDLANPASPPTHIDVSMTSNMDADLSPDGRRIAFRSLRSGKPEVWIAQADGSQMKRLAGPGAESYGNPRWSPDNRELALHGRTNGRSDIYILDPDGSTFRRLTQGSEGGIMPAWSRDGATVYFSSSAGGRHEIRRTPSRGGVLAPFFPDGAYAIEAMDGRTLFVATNARYPKLLEVSPGGAVLREVVSVIANRTAFAVTPAGIYYFAAPGADGRTQLRLHDPASGVNREIARIDRPVESGLSVSADGRTLLFTRVDAEESSLMLVEGFR